MTNIQQQVQDRFPGRLIELRKSSGLSQTEVAKAIDVNLRTIQRYERGERLPQLDKAAALAELFSINIHDFFDFPPYNEVEK